MVNKSAFLRKLEQKIEKYLNMESKLPECEESAFKKLKSENFTVDEIERRKTIFRTHKDINKVAVQANYELLHGLKYIEEVTNGAFKNYRAKGVISIFRCAEVCLENLSNLASRITRDISEGAIDKVRVKMEWCNHFHDTLYELSQLVSKIDDGRYSGSNIGIKDSRAYSDYICKVTEMRASLVDNMPESIDELVNSDLDSSKRYTYFHEFINTNHHLIWLAHLECVRVPNIHNDEDLTAEQFYDSIVRSTTLKEAVQSVDMHGDTYLMQFRAYHQLSEILGEFINTAACDALVNFVQNEEKEELAELLIICNQLLRVITDNLKPILRTLTPNAYFQIRPGLGITSGSNSYNIRKGLFSTIYPLLVSTFRHYLVNFDEALAENDEHINSVAKTLLQETGNHVDSTILRNIVYMYQYIRLWRDAHMQFIKTQIGISRDYEEPTASISGAKNAAQNADRFRKIHTNDLVIPLYSALLGKNPPKQLELFLEGEFDEFMSHHTSNAVKVMYSDVQTRTHVRAKTDKQENTEVTS